LFYIKVEDKIMEDIARLDLYEEKLKNKPNDETIIKSYAIFLKKIGMRDKSEIECLKAIKLFKQLKEINIFEIKFCEDSIEELENFRRSRQNWETI